jgi:iron-sulfur cluster repair protein YtfE (RIC family)
MENTCRHSFSSLEGEHEELEHLFDHHQRALLERNVGTALATLNTFGDDLEQHIEFEEETLLPIYAEEGGETPGGTLKIFQAEHRKLREEAARLMVRTQALYASKDMMGSILALLDEEAMFKGLFRHHALREKNLLFPRLDERTTEEQRKVLFGL